MQVDKDLRSWEFALSEADEEKIDEILAASAREPICVRLKKLMAFRHWNALTFTEQTGLEGYLFSRINHNKIPQPSLRTIVDICIALRLNYAQAVDVLDSGGLTFGNNPTHRAYRRLLLEMHGRTVQECNEYLAVKGIPLLGSIGRDEKDESTAFT